MPKGRNSADSCTQLEAAFLPLCQLRVPSPSRFLPIVSKEDPRSLPVITDCHPLSQRHVALGVLRDVKSSAISWRSPLPTLIKQQ